jgi:hypothetical protein
LETASVAKIIQLASAVKMDTLNITAGSTLQLGSSGYTLELASAGNSGSDITVLTVSGTLTPGTSSTVKYSATNMLAQVRSPLLPQLITPCSFLVLKLIN